MQKGREEIRRNEIYVKNENEDEYVKYQSSNSNLIIRSMLEDDEEYVSKLRKLNWRGRRKLKKQLKEKDSEGQYFVIEEANIFANNRHKIIAIVELYLTEKLNVDARILAFLDTNPEEKAYTFAKNMMIVRIYTGIYELFKKTNNLDSMIYIERAV